MFRKVDKLGNENMGQILIVDDNKQNLKVLSKMLEKEEYEIILATSATQMFSYLEKEIPDLILLDVMMPGMNGYTACNKLKLNDDWKDIPVVFLTALTETRNIIEGFKCGAVDFITKPFEMLEVLVRVETQVELKKTKGKLEESLKKQKELEGIIREQSKLLNDLAITDEVTNLVNKEYIKKEIEDEISRFARSRKLFSLIECGVDNLDEIKELYGKQGFDYVLKQLASYFIERKRTQDVVARWGDQEFLLLAIDTNLEGAQTFSERLRDEIEKMVIKYENRSIKVTATFGVAEYNTNITYEEIVGRVEDAMENGKSLGKNNVNLDARYAFDNEE